MNYQLTTLPGFSVVLARELRQLANARVREVERTRSNDVVSLAYEGDAMALGKLRTIEDAFVNLGRVNLSGSPADMKALTVAPVWGGPLREALGTWSRFTGKPLTKRLTFRVVVQAEDTQWRQYRRTELMLAAERALLRTGTSWRLNRDVAPLEIWLQQVERQLLVSVRLTTGISRQHGGREAERTAALRPSAAAALVLLSDPADTDVFLDPMCGAGTILLERAAMGRYELLLGGDIDQGAVDATLANFGPRHQPRRIERWDATKLPLENSSVTKIVCNLPWGRQISHKAELPQLYGAFLSEAARVLSAGGRMVLLTSEWDILKAALRAEPSLRLEQTIQNLEILGRRADVFRLVRV